MANMILQYDVVSIAIHKFIALLKHMWPQATGWITTPASFEFCSAFIKEAWHKLFFLLEKNFMLEKIKTGGENYPS